MSSLSTNSMARTAPPFQCSLRQTKQAFLGNCSSQLTLSFDDLSHSSIDPAAHLGIVPGSRQPEVGSRSRHRNGSRLVIAHPRQLLAYDLASVRANCSVRRTGAEYSTSVSILAARLKAA